MALNKVTDKKIVNKTESGAFVLITQQDTAQAEEDVRKIAVENFGKSLGNDTLRSAIAPAFSTEDRYKAGQCVWQDGKLYRAKWDREPGAWDATDFSLTDPAAATSGNIISDNLLFMEEAAHTANRFIRVDVYPALEDHIGDTVTISFDLLVETQRPIRVYPYQESGVSIEDTVYVTPETDAYTRFSVTTTVKDWGEKYETNLGTLGFYDGQGEQTISVRRIKIELGEAATPWDLSAQDVQRNLNALSDSMEGKLDQQQALADSGKLLAVGSDGKIRPGDKIADFVKGTGLPSTTEFQGYWHCCLPLTSP